MTIIGLDPGTARIGYGVITKQGTHLSLVTCGLVGVNSTGYAYLTLLEKKLISLLKEHRPSIVAVEKLYFAKNKKTALAVAEARGVILLCAHRSGIPIQEFSPNNIKSIVVGWGHSDKRAVQKAVAIRLGESAIPGPDDVADALAIAIRASLE